MLAVLLAAPALWLFAYGSALIARKNGFAVMERRPSREPREDDLLFDDDEDEGDEGILALGAITHWWLSFARLDASPRRAPPAGARRVRAARWSRAPAAGAAPPNGSNRPSAPKRAMSPDGRARVEPEFFAAMVNDRSVSVDPDDDDVFDAIDDDDGLSTTSRRPAPCRAERQGAATSAPTPRPASRRRRRARLPGARVQREAQTSLIGSRQFEMPSLHFLSEPKNVVRDASLSKDALEQNARLLEGVLEDFGVKGEIIACPPRPGRHALRAGAGARHQIVARHRPVPTTSPAR